ncbi:MAG: matrixin family metalloprotease [Bdellovibrionales bacterium]
MGPAAFFFLSALILGFSGLGVGCAKKETQDHQTTLVEHGDPQVFLRGVKGQAEVQAEELQALNGWWLYRTNVIRARSTKAELLRQHNTTPQNRIWQKGTREFYALQFVSTDDANEVQLKEKNGFQLRFVRASNNRYRLIQFNGVSATLIHFSRHHIREMASFLIQTEDTRELHAIYLATAKERGAEESFAGYKPEAPHYFHLPNNGRWRQANLQLDLCGFPTEQTIELAVQAIQTWQKALTGRMNIQTQIRRSGYRPFSDLNSHCLYWDSTYQPNPASDQMNLGRAPVLEADGRQTLVDGDAFIYSAELAKQKSGNAEFDRQAQIKHLRFALTHEIGHILGLDHQPQSVPSVMAYQGWHELQPIDIEAIQTLYPISQ